MYCPKDNNGQTEKCKYTLQFPPYIGKKIYPNVTGYTLIMVLTKKENTCQLANQT